MPTLEAMWGLLIRLWRHVVENHIGIPGGFFSSVPTAITPDAAGDAGTELAGWAPADHEHAITTGSPSNLGESLSEGSASSFSRSDHTHKLLTRVAKAGTTVGTRKRLNFIDGTGASITVSDDAGNDEVDVTIAATATFGSPVNLGEALADGVSTASARADHVHKLLTRVGGEGATVGTRKMVNFVNGGTVEWVLTDDAGGDKVDVTPEARLVVGVWYKSSFTHVHLQAAAMANDIEWEGIPAGGVIHGVKIKHSVQFAGTGITDYKVSVGIVGNLTKYASAFDVDTAVSSTNYQLSNTFGGEDHDAATSIRLAATSTGANLDQSTAGAIDVWIFVSVAA